MGRGKGKFKSKAEGGVMRNRLILVFIFAIAGMISACSGNSKVDDQSGIAANDHNNNPVNSVTNFQTGISAQPPNNQKGGGRPADDRPVLRFDPAPEDSQIASAMNSSGQMYDTRIFKRHPQLVKVDSTSIGPKEKELKILLRNGQIKIVTTDSIVDLKQATTSQLLRLAGI